MHAKPSSLTDCEPTPANCANEFDRFSDELSRPARSSRTIELLDSYIAADDQLSAQTLVLVALESENDGTRPVEILSLVSLFGGCN